MKLEELGNPHRNLHETNPELEQEQEHEYVYKIALIGDSWKVTISIPNGEAIKIADFLYEMYNIESLPVDESQYDEIDENDTEIVAKFPIGIYDSYKAMAIAKLAICRYRRNIKPNTMNSEDE